MKEKDEFVLEELPWQEILERLHQRYDENLEAYFTGNPEMLELFRQTQIGLRYDAEWRDLAFAPSRQKTNRVWDDLAVEVTQDLQAMLIEDYNVPVEEAQAIQVGYIGAIFFSPAASWGSCCPQWHKCKPGFKVMAPCPC